MSIRGESPVANIRVSSPAPRITSIPSSPAPSVNLVMQSEPIVDMMNIFDHAEQENRYSLRTRNPAQMKPFTTEDARYKNLLKSNPEAIVKAKAIERHLEHRSRNHYEKEGDTQQDVYIDDGDVDEDAGWEDKERRRLELRAEKQRRKAERERLRAVSNQDNTKYPGILQDLSDSDEEDIESISKEAKRLQRRLEKEKKAKEKEERHRQREAQARKRRLEKEKKAKEKEERNRQREEQVRKVKRFPVHKTKTPIPESSTLGMRPHFTIDISDNELEINGGVRSSAADRSSRPPPSSNDQLRIMQDYFGEDGNLEFETSGDPAPEIDARRPSCPSSSTKLPAPQEKFMDGGDGFAVFDDDPWLNGNVELPVGSTWASPTPPINDIVDDDNDDVDDPEEPPQASSSKVSDIELDLSPKRARWLLKMYPKSMMKQLTKEGSKDQKSKDKKFEKADSKRRALSVASDNDQPLLPGQSRVQRTTNAKNVREIKGDTESESDRDADADSSPAPSPQHSDKDSDSDVAEIVETYRPQTRAAEKQKAIEIYSSEDEIDDGDIEDLFFPDEEASTSKHNARLRDENLVDYMLSRSRNIGGARKKKAPTLRSRKQEPQNHASSSSRFKLDFAHRDVQGMAHNRQGFLSFDLPETSKKRKPQKEPGFRPKPAGPIAPTRAASGPSNQNASISKHVSLGLHRYMDHTPDDNEVIHVTPDSNFRAPTRQEKENARRKQKKKNGVYNQHRSSHFIESGARREYYTTVIEEEVFLAQAFHQALAPDNSTQAQREHWSNQFKPPKSPPPRVAKARILRVDDDATEIQAAEATEPTALYAVDLHVQSLHGGRSFDAATDIGKGWLYELIHLVSPESAAIQPMPMQFNEHTVNTEITLETFCATLPQIVNSFFDFATALPVSRSRPGIHESPMGGYGTCFDRIKDLALSFVDTPIMALGWFAVEMAVRISLPKATPRAEDVIPRRVKSSITTLMNLLLQSDLREMMNGLQQDALHLDGKQASQYSAELWVCMIHVLGMYLPKEHSKKSHPFWLVLMEVLRSQAEREDKRLPVEASEKTWLTLFSLCALSQFSNHGMTSGHPRLPGCWDIAVFALKRIRLTATVGESMTKATISRDRYIDIVVRRCLLLNERWKWELHDATPMFNALADIFKSRKFANLWHEECDFAEFFKQANWDLLLSYDIKDTAYVTFLKLIVKASYADPVYIQRKTSPKVKKWLSLVVPLGAVHLPKAMTAKDSQISDKEHQ
ncbi:hypothetical protein BDN70DRAFT_895851, partial [Pholiota conissans]